MTTGAQHLILTCQEDFVDLARAELAAVAPDALLLLDLAPGVLLFDVRQPFGQVAQAWAASPPIFVRHICPVQSALPLAGDARDLERLPASLLPEDAPAAWFAAFDPALAFSVQTRLLASTAYKPFDINRAVADRVAGQTGASVDVRAPQQIVSLVVAQLPAILLRHLDDPTAPIPARQSHPLLCALAGLSLPAENLSDWAGGMHRFAREPEQVSRAEFKLLEALAVFGIDLPPRGRALDLGASPGGWTRVLRQRGQYVTAVDPGDLDPRLAGDSGIRHMRMTAEAYLRADPDRYDLIVNDMRMDGRDSARLMVAFAPALYRHGHVIMTLKLPEQGRRPVLDQALALLRQAYFVAGARQLFHNRSEITLWLRPLP